MTWKNIYIVFNILFCLLLNQSNASERDYADYWISVYDGVVSKEDSPLANTAHSIFDQVRHVADKSFNRLPQLIILKNGDGPWAMSIEDGSILISQEAIEACFNNTDEFTGMSRLAFVFGHEMGHLSADDYWHENGLKTVNLLTNSDIKNRILSLFNPQVSKKNEPIKVIPQSLLIKNEIRADSYGLLYAFIAGFNPKAIIDNDGNIFFSNWGSGPDELHPKPELRASYLKAEYQQLIKTIDLFYLGTRLYQLGQYDDALSFMMAFQKNFPSREVFNTLGLIYYQKAVHTLLLTEPERVLRFRLATILDSDTRLDAYEIVRTDKSNFDDYIQKSIFYFKTAINKDPLYLPSKINLSSAYIMNNNFLEALAILDKTLSLSGDNQDALNNQAIAMYLQGPLFQVNFFQKALNMLKTVIKMSPENSVALYNIARLMLENNHDESSKKYFTLYLKNEQFGFYAKHARKILGLKESIELNSSCITRFNTLSPIQPGKMNEKIKKLIQQLQIVKYDLPMSTVIGNYYSGNGYLFLVIENVVTLVEKHISKNISMSLSDFQQCSPIRIFTNPDSNKTLVYKNFALNVYDGVINKISFYNYNDSFSEFKNQFDKKN